MKSMIECAMSVPDPRRSNHRKQELRDMFFASGRRMALSLAVPVPWGRRRMCGIRDAKM